MKRIMKCLLVIMILLTASKTAYAQDKEDMSKWSFKILLQNADQMDELKVVRFRNTESGRYGFCMQPSVDYSPLDNDYFKERYSDKEIFDIFRAFEMLGDDYYIAAQLMIWEKTSGVRYSFGGSDASDFGEAEITETISSFKDENEEPLIMETSAVYNEKAQIHVDHLEDLEVTESNVSILDMHDDVIEFMIEEENEDGYYIFLEAKHDEMYGSFLYRSQGSQDIFSYEGNYAYENPVCIKINTKQDTFSVSFSKTDEKGNAIEGAEFSLYEIDEKGDEILYFVPVSAVLDLRDLFEVKDDVKIRVSERYQKYLDGYMMKCLEIGYFDCIASIENDEISTRVYVCTNPEISALTKYRTRKTATFISQDKEINRIDGLNRSGRFILCESKPRNGYVFVSDPCMFFDFESAENTVFSFVNKMRYYDLRLYKENPEHTIVLNGAKFKVTYEENGEKKEMIYKTGALNIKQKYDKKYVLYRHENDENIYIGEFKDGYFIKEDAIPGRYLYCLSDDTTVNNSSLLGKETEVIPGAFQIRDIPYDSIIVLTELEAPKGYYIEEAEFTIDADLDYSQIIFRNYRVNSSDMIHNNRHKIPKTCIGN